MPWIDPKVYICTSIGLLQREVANNNACAEAKTAAYRKLLIFAANASLDAAPTIVST